MLVTLEGEYLQPGGSISGGAYKQSSNLLSRRRRITEAEGEIKKLNEEISFFSEKIKKHEEIKKVIHFNSTPVGYQYQISFTIYVDGNLSTFDSHEIADTLEKEIKKEIPEIFLTVIHVNPMNIEHNKK